MTDNNFIPTREPDGSLSIANQKAIQDELYKLLNEYSDEKFVSKHREHLGASVIGEKCSRKLWYGFRWVKLEKHEPRMKRLNARGHLEEEKFAALLTWMGFFVREIDHETKKQYRFSAIGGHYGGSGDTVGLLPWIRDENFRILIEYKTTNAKYFKELKIKGLKLAKPQHWIQMCCYGKEFKIKYGLYCVINKDDDDIHFEFVELDWNLAIQMEKKAADIIDSQLPPPRIAENPAFFECKWCHKQGICWYNEPVEINCRSCKNAVPIDKGKWRCNHWNATIPEGEIVKGCPQHASINN